MKMLIKENKHAVMCLDWALKHLN